jgi:uncharacterized membrane protein YjjB (DUF3815 family)
MSDIIKADTETEAEDMNGGKETTNLKPKQLDEEEELTSDADEVFGTIVDLVKTLLGWSWEGTLGIDERAASVASAYSKINGDELETLVGAESAIIKMGKRFEIIKSLPSFPPLAALSELKAWLLSVEAGELTPREARIAFKEKVTSIEGIYHPLIRVLGVIILDIGLAIDLVGNWEGVVVTIVLSVVTGCCWLASEWGAGWSLAMPFLASFMVTWPVCLCFRRGVVSQNPGILVVSSLFVFIPGDSISMQAVEIIGGRWTAGTARLSYSVIMLVLAAAGAVLGVGVTGLPSDVLDPVDYVATFDWWAIYPGRVAYAVGTNITFNGYPKDIPMATIVTLLTGLIAQGFTRLLGEDFGTFLASVLGVTILPAYVARLPHRAPAYTYMAAPFFTLTPGSYGLRGFEAVIGGDAITGYDDFWGLIKNLIIIAIGMIIGFVIVNDLKKTALWKWTPPFTCTWL